MGREIIETKGGSLVLGELSCGCKQCMEGDKLVIFVTGLCNNSCYYCPISQERAGKDVIYANEKRVRTYRDILEEAKLTNAKGAGITGGEPLLKVNRVCKIIRLLKENFGEKFHIHLYTSGTEVNREILKGLYEAGLDEIRFHPIREDLWERVKIALEFPLKVGVEIPVIPGTEEELKGRIKYLEENDVHFLNLNELEFSERNAENLIAKKFKLRKDSITAVSGSYETALTVLNWAKNNSKLNIHYCPSSLKDSVQLRNRLIKRAKNVSKPFEEITEDGLLLKGVIYGNSLSEIKILRKILINKYEVPPNMITINLKKQRIETAWYIVKEIAEEIKRKKFKVAIVEQYPTENGPDIYLEPL
ncbi:MAG: radical SAM protein [Candidatus Odinarchaeia archaeon]